MPKTNSDYVQDAAKMSTQERAAAISDLAAKARITNRDIQAGNGNDASLSDAHDHLWNQDKE